MDYSAKSSLWGGEGGGVKETGEPVDIVFMPPFHDTRF